MGTAKVFLTLTGLFIFTIVPVIFIKKVTEYYVRRFAFNIWAGTCLLMVGIIILLISGYANTKEARILLQIAGFFALAYVIIQDVRLSNLPMGLIAFIVQVFLAMSILTIFMFIAISLLINHMLARKRFTSQIQPIFLLGIRVDELFARFFRVR